MAQLTITEEFEIEGVLVDPTSVKLNDPTGTYGVKDDSDDSVIVAAGTSMVKESTGVYKYTFEEEVGADEIVYTYYVEWVYGGRTYRDIHTKQGYVGDDLVPTRNVDKYTDWITREFEPLTLITPLLTIEQQVENAIRYWNTHSAYKITTVVDYAPGTVRVQCPAAFKQIITVLPTSASTMIWNDHPLWTLTGITVLDNVTTDMIMMSEAFRNYKIYVGTNFRWAFTMSVEPTVGGWLYCVNVPAGVNSLCIEGTKRITQNEDVKSQYILDWILYYAKALVKKIEGNSLRKTKIIDTPLDGQELYDEGEKERKELQEQLAKDARWIIMIKRK